MSKVSLVFEKSGIQLLLVYQKSRIENTVGPFMFHVLIIPAHLYRVHRANLLTEAAKNTPGPIDLVNPGKPVSVLVFFCLHVDAIGGADCLAKAGGHTFGGTVLVPFEIMNTPPSIRHLHPFFS